MTSSSDIGVGRVWALCCLKHDDYCWCFVTCELRSLKDYEPVNSYCLLFSSATCIDVSAAVCFILVVIVYQSLHR